MLGETGAWELGWEALVAVGTLALASVTLWLVVTTRRVAAASMADVEAQWQPLLIPGDVVRLDPDPEHRPPQFIQIEVRNAGRGPALHVRASLESGGTTTAGVSPKNWSLGAVAAGHKVLLEFSTQGVMLGGALQLLLDYRDLAERQHSSSLTINPAAVERELVFYDVHVFRDHTVTPHGDAVYPQMALRDVRPLPYPRVRDRLRAAVRNGIKGFRSGR